jgi:Tol biopolymer transport system component
MHRPSYDESRRSRRASLPIVLCRAGGRAALLVGMLVLFTAPHASRTTAEPGGDPAAAAFDPDRTQGGIDIWRAVPLPDGGWEVPENLGPNINTTRRETSAIVSPDGRRLYFASRNRADSHGKEDLYVAEWQGDGWGPAVNMGEPVNSKSEEIGPCLFPDGVTLLYSRRDQAQQAYDLILSVLVEEEWLEPIPFGEPLYSPADEQLASITADGRELYFAAHRKSGFGAYDLYVSYLSDEGVWSEPLNLGSRVNSQESDYSPGISPDGKRLFFSSQRDERGNFDLYVCERSESGSWTEPVRLPAPINTRVTEYCPFVASDGSLYFASDRKTGTVVVEEIEE